MIFKDRRGNQVAKPEGRKVKDRMSAYGIAISDSRVLLVRPAWNEEFELPGGGLNKGEKLEEGLKREFLEETGFRINILNKIPIKTKKELFYSDDIDEYFDSMLFFFLVETIGEANSNSIDRKEIKDVSWYNLRELERAKINELHYDVLKEVKKILHSKVLNT